MNSTPETMAVSFLFCYFGPISRWPPYFVLRRLRRIAEIVVVTRNLESIFFISSSRCYFFVLVDQFRSLF